MKKQMIDEKHQLTGENIDLISDKTKEFLSFNGMEHKNIVRLRLSVEEVLLSWQEGLVTDNKTPEISFNIGKRLTRPLIMLSVEGDRINPFERKNESLNEYISRNIPVNIPTFRWNLSILQIGWVCLIKRCYIKMISNKRGE